MPEMIGMLVFMRTLAHSIPLARWAPLLAVGLAISALCFGHGTSVSPSSRVYEVYLANPSNPSFQLAANAVATDGTLSYYTWNEVSRNIPEAVTAGLPPGFDYSPWIPDGQLASAGRVDPNSTEYPRTYAGLDQVSADWPKTSVQAGDAFTIDFHATAVHNPSVWDVWMTRPTWNPSMPLTWDQMEFLERPNPVLSGNHYTFDLEIPRDRSGHHVLWIAWQRDDPVGEVFISTSDLDIHPADALYPGSGDDLLLQTGANGMLNEVDAKTAAVGDVWTLELSSPLGGLVGEPLFLIGQALLPGQSIVPVLGLPDVYLVPAQSRILLQAAALSVGGDSTTFTLPTRAAGRSLIFQGAVLSPMALNGSYASSNVHVLTIP